MESAEKPRLYPRLKARHLALHPAIIERTFTDCVMDLREVIVLDGIDILPDKSGFRDLVSIVSENGNPTALRSCVNCRVLEHFDLFLRQI